MMYSLLMVTRFLSVSAGDCDIQGSSANLNRWVYRTKLCDADNIWNYAYLGRIGEMQSAVSGKIYIRCVNGKLKTSPSENGVYPVVPPHVRLCLNKNSVDTAEQRFGLLKDGEDTFTQVLMSKIKNAPRGCQVIVRATASMRDEETGQRDLDIIRWPDVVTGLRQYFEEDVSKAGVTDVHRRTHFHGMKVMPDETEGEYAHFALQEIASNGCDLEVCKQIVKKAEEGKLVSMEQGGGSLQIFAGQEMWNGAYPDETGLYSNLGDRFIATQLGPNTRCLSPSKLDPDFETAVSVFNRAECRKELRNTKIHRQNTDTSAKFPTLVNDGLYVAFASFFWSALRMDLTQWSNHPIQDMKAALAKVKKFMDDNDTSNAKNCHDGWKMRVKDNNERLCLQALTLEFILEEMVQNSPNANAKIVFLKKLNKQSIAWAIGVADSIKHKVADGQQVLVIDVGSSSTKLMGLTKENGEFGRIEKWAENEDGNLLEVTKANNQFLRVDY